MTSDINEGLHYYNYCKADVCTATAIYKVLISIVIILCSMFIKFMPLIQRSILTHRMKPLYRRLDILFHITYNIIITLCLQVYYFLLLRKSLKSSLDIRSKFSTRHLLVPSSLSSTEW